MGLLIKSMYCYWFWIYSTSISLIMFAFDNRNSFESFLNIYIVDNPFICLIKCLILIFLGHLYLLLLYLISYILLLLLFAFVFLVINLFLMKCSFCIFDIYISCLYLSKKQKIMYVKNRWKSVDIFYFVLSPTNLL